MFITYQISERQSGKTTSAIQLAEQDDNNYIICHDIYYKTHFLRTNIKINFIKRNNIGSLRGSKMNKLIIDEYYYFDNKQKLYNEINSVRHNIKELVILTSIELKINKEIFDFVKEYKYDYPNLIELYETKFNEKPTKDIINEINWLKYDFITDKYTKIITGLTTELFK